MNLRSARNALIAAVLAVLVVGCNNDSPTGPGGGNGLTVQSLRIQGELMVSAGSTSQLNAIATMSNGTTQNVTNQATWTSSATNIATVSATGLLTGVLNGTADISATFSGQTGRGTAEVAAARFRLTVNVQSVTAINTCDDFTQGLSSGEFALRVRATTASGGGLTMTQTNSYPSRSGAISLGQSVTRTLNTTRNFTITGSPGQFLRILFDATEWDTQIVIFPPSTRNIHDSRMSDRTVTRTHSYGNGSFGSLGSNSLTLGTSSCGLRLNYTVTVTPL